EPLGLINLQAAILAPPLVVGLFRDPRTPADLPRSLALRDPHLGFTQEADDLLSRLPLPCHLHISSRDFGNSRIRSSHLVPHQGSRPRFHAEIPLVSLLRLRHLGIALL